jgi:FkbM family methyltransferase
MTDVAAKTIDLKASYSDRRFLLTGSMTDESVIGAIAKAGGSWEPQIMNLMAQTISRDDVCLDIGANVGVHTLVMADLAPDGMVHAFEASSTNYHFMATNINSNGFDNIRPYHLGLSNSVGDKEFYYLSDFAGCSFAQDTDRSEDVASIIQSAWGAPWRYVKEKVRFTTLDEWMRNANIERVDFIKLDVEGSEKQVILGGDAMLSRYNPTLITEFNVNSFTHYFKVDPESYWNILAAKFRRISIIHEDGQITPIRQYSELTAQLTSSRWWVDLLCSNR